MIHAALETRNVFPKKNAGKVDVRAAVTMARRT